MRRLAFPLVIILLAGSMIAPSMAASADRTVTKNYTMFRGQIQFNDQEVAWMGTQAELFHTRAGERWVTFSLEDETGNPVLGRVQVNGRVVRFCSDTNEALRVRRGDELKVSATFGLCDGGFSVVTEGIITATFSK